MKALKIVLIVLFALLLAASAGLLTYGAIKGPKKAVTMEEITLDAPSLDYFVGEYADLRIDMAALANATDVSNNQKIANMLVNASYNNLFINQFFFKARMDAASTQTGKRAFSDYFRAKTGMNSFYQMFAYTGVMDLSKYKIEYEDQRLDNDNILGTGDAAEYDFETETWSVSYAVNTKSNTPQLPARTPYQIYSWYDFPLDLGGLKKSKGKDTEGRSEEIDGSLIDPKTVVIEEKGDTVPYYSLTFKAIIKDANASSETLDRFADSCGQLKDVEIYQLTFNVEIWKDAGVFRRIGFESRAMASLSGKKGEVEISKMIEFSYDVNDGSVAAHIKKLDAEQGNTIFKNFSAKNQAKINEEIAALPEKKTSDDKKQEE